MPKLNPENAAKLVGSGIPTREVAAILGVSIKTIHNLGLIRKTKLKKVSAS
jgi:DNA-binding CsgD family transcriptional regulator